LLKNIRVHNYNYNDTEER